MVDPTALNEAKRKNKNSGEACMVRAAIVSFLGALAGAAVCVAADYFIGNITGILYLFPGMSAYAFYLYFVERQNQRKIHFVLIIAACIVVSAIAVFVDCAILYAPKVQLYTDGSNFMQKTFDFYSKNISANGLSSYKITVGGQYNPVYSISLLAFHIICAVMTCVGFGISLLFVKCVGGSWEKKHGRQDYSHSSKVHRNRRNNKKGKRRH